MDLVEIWKEAKDMRVLVSGSRDYANEEAINERLNKVGRGRKVEIIEGDAKGADRAAKLWGQRSGRKVHTFPANWRRHGRAAGPIRNQQMLDEGNPDLVLAFTNDPVNSKGTRHMVRSAKKAKVPTVVYGPDGVPIRRRDLPDQ